MHNTNIIDNNIEVEDSQDTVGDMFENEVSFETAMDNFTQMSNFNETDQIELPSASQISQNKASIKVSEQSYNDTNANCGRFQQFRPRIIPWSGYPQSRYLQT